MDTLIPETFKAAFINAYKAADWNDLAFVPGINKHGPVKTKYFEPNGGKKYLGGYKRKGKSHKRKSYKRKSYKRKSYKRKK